MPLFPCCVYKPGGSLPDITRPRRKLWMSVVLLASFVIVIEGIVAIGCTVIAADDTSSEWLKVLGLSRWDHHLTSNWDSVVCVANSCLCRLSACLKQPKSVGKQFGSVLQNGSSACCGVNSCLCSVSRAAFSNFRVLSCLLWYTYTAYLNGVLSKALNFFEFSRHGSQ